MKTAIASLKSSNTYSQNRNHDTPKLDRELAADYEKRTWKNRAHINSEGYVFIPPLAFKNALSEAAKYLGMQVSGKGKERYTKHFEAGILVLDPLVLPIHVDDLQYEEVFVPADGVRGGKKRVWKTFPVIPEWEGAVTFIIVDDIIAQEVFVKHLELAGKLIGIGRWRPRNNGIYGRFDVVTVGWTEG